jgi:hypothetical protein
MSSETARPGRSNSSGVGGPKPALMRVATRTYREFVWSLCFGLVTVASVSVDG